MSDERRASVCGDPVEPTVADEPGVPGDDLHPHETSVEDHEGDEGPEDESDPASTVELSNVKGYPLILITTDGKYRTDIKCEHCDMPVAFTMKLSPADKEVPYHLYYEREKENGDEKHMCQILGVCEYIYSQ